MNDDDDFDDGNDSDSSSCSCDSNFIREIEAHCLKKKNNDSGDDDDDDDGDDDDEWVEAEEATVEEYDNALALRSMYESSLAYPFDMFTKARHVDKNKENAAAFFKIMVHKMVDLAWRQTDKEIDRVLETTLVVPGYVESLRAGRQLLQRIMEFDAKYRGVLPTYHTRDEKRANDSYRRGIELANKLLVAHDYERFVARAKIIVPNITEHTFPDHVAMWKSFFGWYDLLHGPKIPPLDEAFFQQMHLANMVRKINRSVINTYYSGNAKSYPAHHEVTIVKLREQSPWMINDYGSAEEIEVVSRIERYVRLDTGGLGRAVPTAHEIMNWENLFWYNTFPLEAIIAFSVVQPYKLQIKEALDTIGDADRSFFFRKHLQGPDLPETYTVPIIPSCHAMADIAGAWVWDIVDRGGVESNAWEAYCKDILHPCAKIAFDTAGGDGWLLVDFCLPDSIGFDTRKTFKSGKPRVQTKETLRCDAKLLVMAEEDFETQFTIRREVTICLLKKGGALSNGSLCTENINLQGDHRGIRDLALVLNMPCQFPGCNANLASDYFFMKPGTFKQSESSMHPIMLHRKENVLQGCLHMCKSCFKSKVRIDVTAQLKHLANGSDAASACVQHGVAFLRHKSRSETLLETISKPVFGRGHSRLSDASDDKEIRLRNILEKSHSSQRKTSMFTKHFALEPFGILYVCDAVPDDPRVSLAALIAKVGHRSGKSLTSQMQMQIHTPPTSGVLGILKYSGNHNKRFETVSKRNYAKILQENLSSEEARVHKLAKRSNSSTVASYIASVSSPRLGKFHVSLSHSPSEAPFAAAR